MAYSKTSLLDKAVEITKEYARSEGGQPLDKILRLAYEELKKINEDSDK